MKFKAFTLILVLLAGLSGCTSYKNVPYLQDPEAVNQYGKEIPLYDAKIMPKDLLSITVNTTDPQAAAPFNLTVQTPLNAALTNINTTTQLQVVLVKPEKFEDASGIADHLLAKRTVVLNLESTNREIARRLVDFLSGVAYANGGQIKKVANSTYIITPYNVGVMGDSLLDELENSGLYL